MRLEGYGLRPKDRSSVSTMLPAMAEGTEVPRDWQGLGSPSTRHACMHRLTAPRAQAAAGGGGSNAAARLDQGLVRPNPFKPPRSFLDVWSILGQVPAINIVIMVAGTRGDVQPACALGVRLQTHGHHVRVATHKPYKEFVLSCGLDFYPLAGDPQGLMALTVKHRGMLPSTQEDYAYLRHQFRAIVHSSYEACVQPIPASTEEFKPDLIIATAITYSAAHCAEKLRVPLHTISTIPWRPTKELCHPWARVFEATITTHVDNFITRLLPPCPAHVAQWPIPRLYSWARSLVRTFSCAISNYLSTVFLDLGTWASIADILAAFRRDLGLRPWGWGNSGLVLYRHPATFTFSPSLVPRPRDWPSSVAVSGPLRLDQARGLPDVSSHKQAEYKLPPELKAFLDAEPDRPPIYIGFGSMTLSDAKSAATIIRKAVAATGVRAVVSQGSWGQLQDHDSPDEVADGVVDDGELESVVGRGGSSSSRQGSASVMLIGDVPHEHLFSRCSAVIHHGGVGTTAAALMAGCPTFICPSFGDLFFWGEVCHRAGVGPPPVPIYELTEEKLASAIKDLQQPKMRDRAREVGRKVALERGLDVAVPHIYRHLDLKKVLQRKEGRSSPTLASFLSQLRSGQPLLQSHASAPSTTALPQLVYAANATVCTEASAVQDGTQSLSATPVDQQPRLSETAASAASVRRLLQCTIKPVHAAPAAPAILEHGRTITQDQAVAQPSPPAQPHHAAVYAAPAISSPSKPAAAVAEGHMSHNDLSLSLSHAATPPAAQQVPFIAAVLGDAAEGTPASHSVLESAPTFASAASLPCATCDTDSFISSAQTFASAASLPYAASGAGSFLTSALSSSARLGCEVQGGANGAVPMDSLSRISVCNENESSDVAAAQDRVHKGPGGVLEMKGGDNVTGFKANGASPLTVDNVVAHNDGGGRHVKIPNRTTPAQMQGASPTSVLVGV